MNTSPDQLNDILPQEMNGWVLDEAVIYDRTTLYDYINGGAELYLSFGFEQLYHWRYQKEGEPDLIVDIFDMGESAQAYGVFTHSREEIDSTFGQGSQYTAGLLLFWKGPYYVSILASPETEASRETVFGLGRLLDEHLRTTGKRPSLIDLLPQENLIPESIRYFNHPLWVNTYYFLTDENIFQLGGDTRAVLARYQETGLLLITKYPDAAAARRVLKDFQKLLMPEDTAENLVQIEDETWLGGKQKAKFLTVVFNCDSKSAADSLMNAALAEIE